jgi:hypothetical protein
MAKHTCGSCRLCCKVFDLPNKPAGVWCQHAGKKGCSIYANRPAICQVFRCLYLECGLDGQFRPDRCGVIVAPGGDVDGVQLCGVIVAPGGDVDGVQLWCVFQCYAEPRLRPPAAQLIEELKAAGGACVIMSNGPRRVEWDKSHYPHFDAQEALLQAVDTYYPGGKTGQSAARQ